MQIVRGNKERRFELLCQQFIFTVKRGTLTEDIDDKDDAEETVWNWAGRGGEGWGREEEARDWRKLRDEELNCLCSSSYTRLKIEVLLQMTPGCCMSRSDRLEGFWCRHLYDQWVRIAHSV
jgi:hypothetical protein